MNGKVLFCVHFWIISLEIKLVVCHTPENNSDVIVTYSGHAEANFEPEIIVKNTSLKQNINREISATDYPITDKEDVVFIPNEKPPLPRYGDALHPRNRMTEQNVMQKSVGDILNEQKIRIESDTEASKDIFFITGKNNEDTEIPTKTKKSEIISASRRSGKEIEKLNCQDLDCNNTISSVCGGKYEHRQWRYRIFLNQCYFRKVNCAFNYAENRYKVVPIENCKHVGAHFNRTPMVYNPSPPAYHQEPLVTEPVNQNLTRRSSIFRRAMSKDIDGQACAHACPIMCPEDYEPECAISPSGNRRVFLNHCKLDHNSCSFGAVWYKRPLSDCVGGKTADMRQNRAFIGWMQKVGIVDNKGRLVLN